LTVEQDLALKVAAVGARDETVDAPYQGVLSTSAGSSDEKQFTLGQRQRDALDRRVGATTITEGEPFDC